jgi:WD40 repeat protein
LTSTPRAARVATAHSLLIQPSTPSAGRRLTFAAADTQSASSAAHLNSRAASASRPRASTCSGDTLYCSIERPLVDGTPEFEIRAATPENAPFRVLARIPASRVPIWQIVNPALSPDGKWLAQALTDGVTTNVWALSTTTGEWRQITEFGERPTFIARRVSWSSDGRSILAAVGEGDSDIVLLEGLTNVGRE